MDKRTIELKTKLILEILKDLSPSRAIRLLEVVRSYLEAIES